MDLPETPTGPRPLQLRSKGPGGQKTTTTRELLTPTIGGPHSRQFPEGQGGPRLPLPTVAREELGAEPHQPGLRLPHPHRHVPTFSIDHFQNLGINLSASKNEKSSIKQAIVHPLRTIFTVLTLGHV